MRGLELWLGCVNALGGQARRCRNRRAGRREGDPVVSNELDLRREIEEAADPAWLQHMLAKVLAARAEGVVGILRVLAALSEFQRAFVFRGDQLLASLWDTAMPMLLEMAERDETALPRRMQDEYAQRWATWIRSPLVQSYVRPHVPRSAAPRQHRRAPRRLARRTVRKATGDPPPPPDPPDPGPRPRRSNRGDDARPVARESSRWGLGPTRPQLERGASHDCAAAAGESTHASPEAPSPPSQALFRERSDPPGVAACSGRARGARRRGVAS